MKKTRLKSLLLAVAFTLLTAVSSLAWDKELPETKGLGILPNNGWASSFTYVKVEVRGMADAIYVDNRKEGKFKGDDVNWSTRRTYFEQNGSGYVVRDGYILTAAHVIEPESVVVNTGSSSAYRGEPLRVINRSIYVYDFSSTPHVAELFYIDHEDDVAILKYEPNNSLIPGNPHVTRRAYAGLFDNYGMQESGDVIAVVLHERNEDGELISEFKLVTGIVLNRSCKELDPVIIPFCSFGDFVVDFEAQSGDSGSPVFAFYHGTPVLIGITRGVTYNEGEFTGSIVVHTGNLWKFITI